MNCSSFRLFWVFLLVVQVNAQVSGPTVPTLTNVASVTPVVTVDLGKRHGVWWEKQQDVCFPSEFVTILTRYEYGKFCQSVNDWLKKARVTLGMFGSEFDNQDAIRNRICADDVRVDAICPVNRLKNLTKVAALKRNQLYQFLDELTAVKDGVIAGFQNFPVNEASIWPDNLNRVQVQGNVARLPVTFSFATEVDQSLFDGNGDQPTLPEKDTELESRLTQMTMTVLKLLATCNDLKLIIHNLDRHQFPTDLVSYAMLSSTLSMLMDNHDRMTLAAVQYLETSPVTKVYQVHSTDVLSEAVLEIKSQFPAKNHWNILSNYRLYVLPISRVGYIQELKWKKMNVTSKSILIDHNNATMVEYEPSQLNCQQANWESCRICELPALFSPIYDKCLMNLFSRGSDAECTYIEQSPPPAALIPFSSNHLALVDKSPGSLVQICDKDNKVFPLQPTMFLNLNNSCSYELLDDENDISFLPALLPRNLEIIGTNLVKKIPNIVDDLNSLQKHFKEYGYIYFIGFGVGFLLLGCCITCFVFIRCRGGWSVSRRRQDLRDARARTSDQAAEDRLLLQTLNPMPRPLLPARLTAPRITETTRGLIIETV